MTPTGPSLKGRALRLLARREHSRAELERKLAAFEEVPGTLAQALDALQAKDFINEQRVVDSVVHRRAPRLGAGRVRQELERKGLDREAVASAVAALASTELARARDVWQKKFGGTAAVDAADRARQMRFLASRGFSGEVVRRVVNAPDDDTA
ncbi:MAG: recombination regulator RecX [Pseudomonadota bacterium]